MAIAATTNESLDNTVIGNNSKNTNSGICTTAS